MLNCEQLRALLRYDATTGVFTWIVNRGGRFRAGTVAGWLTEKGYIKIRIGGRDYKAHRLAWLYMTGCWPEHEVDHENTIRSDNRWDNLREATGAQNSRNRRKPVTNTSGFKGVSWNKITCQWQAVIHIDGKRVILGQFNSPEDAHQAYVAAASEHYGEFARAA